MLADSRPVLALVPARGGSKGVPRKNLAAVAGLPLIGHTIRAAAAARDIDSTFVSSDDPEILAVAESFGARALARPASLATDDASAVDVVRHFIDAIDAGVRDADPLVVYLQPTSPLRGPRHIDSALELLQAQAASALVSVVELAKSPYKAFRIGDDGRLRSLFDERQSNMRRQDLPSCFMPNGAIYAFTVSAFDSRGGFPSDGAIPYLMNDIDSIDIDSADDLARAERNLRDLHG